MKIILISTVSNLGKIGDVVDVANGYARNLLIPNKKAICFTKENYKKFEVKKHEFEQEDLKNVGSAARIKSKIEGQNVAIIENASDDGRLYGSVSASTIADKINKILGENVVLCNHVFLKKPIKEIGVYSIKISPHPSVSFVLPVVVSRSESEVEAVLAKKQSAAN